MNKNFAKKISALLGLTMVMQVACFSAVVNADVSSSGGSAGGYGGTGIASQSNYSEVKNVLNYIDNSDYSMLVNAKGKIDSLNYSNISDEKVETLLTDEFVAKFADRDAAATAAKKLLAQSIGVYYSKTGSELDQNIESSMNLVVDDFETAFGTDATLYEWFDLLLFGKKRGQEINTGEDRRIWALGSINTTTESLDEVYGTLDKLEVKAIKEMLDEARYADIKAAFESVGWTAENIVSSARSITGAIDLNNTAEFALVKAAARSTAKVTINDVEKDVPFAGVDLAATTEKVAPVTEDTQSVAKIFVLDIDVSDLVGYESSNPDLISVVPTSNGFEITQKPGKGNATITFTRDPRAISTGVPSDVTAPLLKNWIVRYNILVANTLSQVTGADWKDATLEPGVAIWQSVANAKSYTVDIYKDGVKVNSVIATADDELEIMTANLEPYTTDPGLYTFTVTAKGDIAEEVSEVSEFSGGYSVNSVLDKPNVSWDNEGIKVNWNEIDDATKYVVNVYSSIDNSIVAGPIEVSAPSLSYDFTDTLKGNFGTFYATVQAKGEGTVAGSVSDNVNSIDIGAKAYGYVKLERDFAGGTTEKDYAGVKVYVEGAAKTAVTDAEGKFELSGLRNKTYTVRFTAEGFLTRVETITIKNADFVTPCAINTKNKAYLMYFGDLDGTPNIGIGDIIEVVNRFSYEDITNSSDDVFDADGDNKVYLNELRLVLKNNGFTTIESYR